MANVAYSYLKRGRKKDKQMTKIGTHPAPHHADDVAATAMLKLIAPSAQIVRSRDPAVLAECNILVDVGGKYNPPGYEAGGQVVLDHHQEEFTLSRSIDGGPRIMYSSSGLVWEHYAEEIMTALEIELSDEDYDIVIKLVEKRIIMPIDAADNGKGLYKNELGVRGYDISTIINRMNSTVFPHSEEDQMACFKEAMTFFSRVLEREIRYCAGMAKNIAIMEKALIDRETPEVLVLDSFIPGWQDILYSLPEKLHKDLLFIITPAMGCGYQILAVPPESDFSAQKRTIPYGHIVASQTHTQDEIDEIVELPGLTFCHKNGFIAKADDLQHATAIAAKLAAS